MGCQDQGGPGWGQRSRRAAKRLVPRRWGLAYLRKMAARPGAGPRSTARAMHGSSGPSSAVLQGKGETKADARGGGGDDLPLELELEAEKTRGLGPQKPSRAHGPSSRLESDWRGRQTLNSPHRAPLAPGQGARSRREGLGLKMDWHPALPRGHSWGQTIRPAPWWHG